MIEDNNLLKIPQQPNGLWDNALFTKYHKRCIDLMILIPSEIMQREDIFKMILAPDKSPMATKNAFREFMGSTNTEMYWNARKEQLETWKGLRSIDEDEESMQDSADDGEFDIEKARLKIKQAAYRTALSTPPPREKAWEIATKESLKEKDNEEHLEPPRRYLPETCNECRYKIWVDTLVEQRKAKIIDDGKNTVSAVD